MRRPILFEKIWLYLLGYILVEQIVHSENRLTVRANNCKAITSRQIMNIHSQLEQIFGLFSSGPNYRMNSPLWQRTKHKYSLICTIFIYFFNEPEIQSTQSGKWLHVIRSLYGSFSHSLFCQTMQCLKVITQPLAWKRISIATGFISQSRPMTSKANLNEISSWLLEHMFYLLTTEWFD